MIIHINYVKTIKFKCFYAIKNMNDKIQYFRIKIKIRLIINY